MRSKLWATLEKKNHTYYEQDPEKVSLFLKKFNSLKHLAPVYIDETGFDTYFIENMVAHWDDERLFCISVSVVSIININYTISYHL